MSKALNLSAAARRFHKPTDDPLWLKVLLTAAALGFIALLLLLPLLLVFLEAFAKGFSAFWTATAGLASSSS